MEHSRRLEFGVLLLLLLLAALLGVGRAKGATKRSYLLQSKSLPADLSFMPSLSNGHVGYTVFGDAIFMNGVYNGAGGNSQRARIPNWLNISAAVCDSLGCERVHNDTAYEMNLHAGYFHYRRHYARLGVTLEQRSYAHHYYNRAVVYELLASRVPGSNASLYLQLTSEPGAESVDFQFEVLNNGSSAAADFRLLRGRTKLVEFAPLQSQPAEIYVLFSESLVEPLHLQWPSWQQQLQHRIVISLDRQQQVARKELHDVLELQADALMQRHAQCWHDFWRNHFAIEIVGDLQLWRTINAGIFYLASSLPALSSNQPNEQYYGLNPTGLARGNLAADYQGHNFWDTEIWMLPVATQLSFDYAKQLFDYRWQHLPGARYNANATGYRGARFPWESAYTGTEVTNPCCPEVAQQEIHISPDICFAMQKFYAQSNDTSWLCARAWPICLEVAEFLQSRASCKRISQTCHLLNVMGPDEDHANVTDNVYTNAVSKIALEFAAWMSTKCGNASTAALAQAWRQLSARLVILRDTQLDYHPQHQGYQRNEIVKQADTILLGYPLQFDTSSTHLNDLNHYANVTRESGPAMTWSMFAANYLATADSWRAAAYFQRGYESYVRPEFKVWSETPIGYAGSANFLTGIGGFLQALIFGYGGLDFALMHGKPEMQLRSAEVPPKVQRIKIKYIQFAQSKCSYEFEHNSSTMSCVGSPSHSFELVQGAQRKLLDSSFNVTIRRGDVPLQIRVL